MELFTYLTITSKYKEDSWQNMWKALEHKKLFYELRTVLAVYFLFVWQKETEKELQRNLPSASLSECIHVGPF